jgi:hypothetical protein
LRQLTSGDLPDDLLSALPEGCAGWEQTTRPRHWPLASPISAELILHYDLLAIYRLGLDGYRDDPVLMGLLAGREITLVNLRVRPQELRARLERRHQQKWARPRKRLMLRTVETARAARALIAGSPPHRTRLDLRSHPAARPIESVARRLGLRELAIHEQVASIYDDGLLSEQLFERWQRFIGEIDAQRPFRRIIDLAASSAHPGEGAEWDVAITK